MVGLHFLWEMFQTKYIYDTKTELRTRSREVESKTIDLKGEIRALNEKVDMMALISQSLWAYIQEHHELTDEDLMNKIKEVDLFDGVQDGKVAHRKTHKCKKCHHIVNKRHNKCYYCGSEGLFESIFEML